MRADEVKKLSVVMQLSLGVLALGAVAAPLSMGLTSPAGAAEHVTQGVGKIELLAGKRVKLQFENVDVRSLIRAMGEAANVNILVSDQVSGTVTVKLAEMPWAQAFDIILNSQGLVKHEKDGILYIDQASA